LSSFTDQFQTPSAHFAPAHDEAPPCEVLLSRPDQYSSSVVEDFDPVPITHTNNPSPDHLPMTHPGDMNPAYETQSNQAMVLNYLRTALTDLIQGENPNKTTVRTKRSRPLIRRLEELRYDLNVKQVLCYEELCQFLVCLNAIQSLTMASALSFAHRFLFIADFDLC
jgi:hypothetical protein